MIILLEGSLQYWNNIVILRPNKHSITGDKYAELMLVKTIYEATFILIDDSRKGTIGIILNGLCNE